MIPFHFCQGRNASRQDLSFQTFEKVLPLLAKACPYYCNQDEIINIDDNEKFHVSDLHNIHVKICITLHKLNAFQESI